jgi:hypothetical protein
MRYHVTAYVVARIKVVAVEADSQGEAIAKVEEKLNPNVHIDREVGVDVEGMGCVEYVEYADDIVNFLVDEYEDTQFARSEWYELSDDGVWQACPSMKGDFSPRVPLHCGKCGVVYPADATHVCREERS